MLTVKIKTVLLRSLYANVDFNFRNGVELSIGFI